MTVREDKPLSGANRLKIYELLFEEITYRTIEVLINSDISCASDS